MNSLEREVRRQAIRRDAKSRTKRFVKKYGEDGAQLVALIDVLVDRVIDLEDKCDKLKRGRIVNGR